jgi:hypothetical protein
MKQAQALQHIIASYRPDFEKTRRQIVILAKYKELHNCLHAVQERLEEITNNVNRLKSGDNVLRYLKDGASYLKELVTTARAQISGLPTENEERDWIDTLDACAADMKTTTMPTASVADREKVLDVPDRLARILPTASRVNAELVGAAKHVRLDNFAETMRSFEQQLGATMPANTQAHLQAGSLAVGRLRSRLAGLVAEHDEWQSLNTDFEYTKTQTKHQPQARFSSWKQFKAKLIGLCDAFPQEAWSVELKETIGPWMADDAPPEPQIPSSIHQIDDDFLSFYQQCIKRFIKVDDELNTLCTRVTSFTVPLNLLLQL